MPKVTYSKRGLEFKPSSQAAEIARPYPATRQFSARESVRRCRQQGVEGEAVNKKGVEKGEKQVGSRGGGEVWVKRRPLGGTKQVSLLKWIV